jgi:hypothetical protein
VRKSPRADNTLPACKAVTEALGRYRDPLSPLFHKADDLLTGGRLVHERLSAGW